MVLTKDYKEVRHRLA